MSRQTLHLDASEGVWFERQLEAVDTRVYEVKYAALKARQLIPVVGGIPEWARVYRWAEMEGFGSAEFIANMGDDLPRADVSASDDNTRIIYPIGDSYGYDVLELKAMASRNIALTDAKARAARRVIETKIDSILSLGDDDHGLEGLLSFASAQSYTLATKLAGGTSWGTVGAPNATAQEIASDLMGIAADMVDNTDEVFNRVVITLPIAQYNLAAQLPMGAGVESTPLKFAQANSQFIEAVVPWNRCKTAGTGSTTRMACYVRDPDVLGGIVSMEFTPFAPQLRNLKYIVNNLASCGGAVLRYPKGCSYADGL